MAAIDVTWAQSFLPAGDLNRRTSPICMQPRRDAVILGKADLQLDVVSQVTGMTCKSRYRAFVHRARVCIYHHTHMLLLLQESDVASRHRWRSVRTSRHKNATGTLHRVQTSWTTQLGRRYLRIYRKSTSWCCSLVLCMSQDENILRRLHTRYNGVG